MASAVTKTAGTKSISKPSITLTSHRDEVESICYFPDGQRMISGSEDTTARLWDLKTGKEIEAARGVCEGSAWTVAVSRNGRWVTTGGGDGDRGELQACEVETGIVKRFEGHSSFIECIDISVDNLWLASGSWDKTARIWNLDTGKLVAGPFKSEYEVGAVRLSPDSKKLAVMSWTGSCLEVWDVQSQKLDVKVGQFSRSRGTLSPLFWTNTKNITAAFSFTAAGVVDTIYEFDVSTLDIVGTPFKGHTEQVIGIALSFDQVLLVSASRDDTIKLWAFESRQLLASFDVQDIYRLVLSPNSRQLAYTTRGENDNNIFICETPPGILAQALRPVILHAQSQTSIIYSILMQLVVLPDTEDHRYLSYRCRDLRLQETCSNPLSLDSANFFTFLARTRSLFVTFNLAILLMSLLHCPYHPLSQLSPQLDSIISK